MDGNNITGFQEKRYIRSGGVKKGNEGVYEELNNEGGVEGKSRERKRKNY